MRHWIHHAISSHRQLIDLLERVRNYRIRTRGTDPETLQQYDRQRLVKDSLLERIASACVDISTTGQIMLASLAAHADAAQEEITSLADEFGEDAGHGQSEIRKVDSIDPTTSRIPIRRTGAGRANRE